MRKGDATRARIIEVAARKAAVRGLAAVSLGDLAEAAGLSKSGLFKHFESKDDMHLAVADEVTGRFREFLLAPIHALPPGRARLEALFENWLRWGETEWAESGCPVNQLAIEFDDQPGPVRDLLRDRLGAFRGEAIEEFRRLRDPPLPADEARSAYVQMRGLILGQSEARRMLGDADAARSARAAFHALLDRTERPVA